MSRQRFEPDQVNGINSLVRGDKADARELRANLAVFARQTDSPRIRSLVADVLSGRTNVREVFRTKEFGDVLERRLGNIEKGLDALSEEQRAELFDENRERTAPERLGAMRDAHDPDPGAAVEKPPRPEEDDEAYFENFSVFDHP